VHLMAGSTDYLLRVLGSDLEAYEQFLKRKLTRLRGVAHVQTAFSLSSLKAAPSVPLTHLEVSKRGSRRVQSD
jgi:Lrp/AsnC family transcriptional regulator, leucine-responsive regulatory protein